MYKGGGSCGNTVVQSAPALVAAVQLLVGCWVKERKDRSALTLILHSLIYVVSPK